MNRTEFKRAARDGAMVSWYETYGEEQVAKPIVESDGTMYILPEGDCKGVGNSDVGLGGGVKYKVEMYRNYHVPGVSDLDRYEVTPIAAHKPRRTRKAPDHDKFMVKSDVRRQSWEVTDVVDGWKGHFNGEPWYSPSGKMAIKGEAPEGMKFRGDRSDMNFAVAMPKDSVSTEPIARVTRRTEAHTVIAFAPTGDELHGGIRADHYDWVVRHHEVAQWRLAMPAGGRVVALDSDGEPVAVVMLVRTNIDDMLRKHGYAVW